MWLTRLVRVSVPVVVVGLVGCRHPHDRVTPEPGTTQMSALPATDPVMASQPATAAASQPAAALVPYADAKRCVRFCYPASWHPVPDDTVLTLVPAGEQSIGHHVVVIDQPDLPPHIPGMIPMRAVVNGFAGDLKGRYKDVRLDPVIDLKIDGLTGRLVRATAVRKSGEAVTIEAVLLVRKDKDRVYLVDAESDADQADAMAQAFDAITASMRWLK